VLLENNSNISQGSSFSSTHCIKLGYQLNYADFYSFYSKIVVKMNILQDSNGTALHAENTDNMLPDNDLQQCVISWHAKCHQPCSKNTLKEAAQ